MLDFSWNTRSPLQKALVAGRHGVANGQAGVTLEEVGEIELIQVMSRRGCWAETGKAAKKLFGIEPPSTPKAVVGKGATLIWSGPDQFMVLALKSQGAEQQYKLRKAVSGIASLSDQSDGRCLIRISGPRARDALAKFSSLDLHDAAFAAGTAATTSINHTSVNLWRGADEAAPVYYVLVFSSFADSLWHTMVDSSLEYGVEVGRLHAI
ncbi:sarcosine oxidase subunit gamma family protein [Mesorhizobium sp. WSM2239]|uniref:Sarcosine oxidase subunit gamma family protein n=2 Tax=unclassified Mesorhizobium TaxID=325217 RepID=A0AAU8D7Y2_9HYPH